MTVDDAAGLLEEIAYARGQLPASHRQLLELLGVQEQALEDWPDAVLDLFRTLKEPTPTRASLDGAVAVWLGELRLVAFNAELLRKAVLGLDDDWRRTMLARIAWHEYGHALSVTRATDDHRRQGPALLSLCPAGVRQAIDYPGRYRASQVFDEIVATLYAMLVGRVRTEGYVQPEYLHPDVFTAFQEVIPWPQIP